MKKLLSSSIVALLFLFSVGCTKMPLRGDYVEEKTPPQVQADEQSAAIVFFREWAFTGGGMSYFMRWVVNFVRHAMRPSELINPVAFVQMLPGRCTPVQLAAAACCKKFLYIQ